MAVEENPTNDNVLLIAYESSNIIEWDLVNRKLRLAYGPLKNVSHEEKLIHNPSALDSLDLASKRNRICDRPR